MVLKLLIFLVTSLLVILLFPCGLRIYHGAAH